MFNELSIEALKGALLSQKNILTEDNIKPKWPKWFINLSVDELKTAISEVGNSTRELENYFKISLPV